MNFGGILAGGSGTRMGKTDLPKQFLSLGQKPIIIHTIEQFLISTNIDEIVVAVPQNWISYTEDIINRYCKDKKIHVIQGGATRNETIMNVCNYIQNISPNEENIVVTHDAVRPFITQRIIKENIEMFRAYKKKCLSELKNLEKANNNIKFYSEREEEKGKSIYWNLTVLFGEKHLKTSLEFADEAIKILEELL